jgi:DNA sulfur modification protein DndC
MKAGLWDGHRAQMTDSIALTAETLASYGERFEDWVFAWSGGKDSTATLTVCLWLIASGRVKRPRSLVVLYADTRQELLPLWFVAKEIMDELRELGVEVRVVLPPLDRRMWVYILGRGVPPPNNNTLRYCTRQIKIEPMAAEVRAAAAAAGRQVLVITGVRLGESAARDGRIALACSTNGAECGQGYFQTALEGGPAATLAPIVHWRVCHVWEWLTHWAPLPEYGDWSTRLLAEAYGGRDGDEAQEINARTGCVCCPLASRDTALDALVRLPQWAYLAPLRRIRELYRWLRLPAQRLRKRGGETRKDGTLCKNQQRMGPIHLEARVEGLRRLLVIHDEVNTAAMRLGRPLIDHVNVEEGDRILALIAARTWPDGWAGDEPVATELQHEHRADGSVQHLLFGLEEAEG